MQKTAADEVQKRIGAKLEASGRVPTKLQIQIIQFKRIEKDDVLAEAAVIIDVDGRPLVRLDNVLLVSSHRRAPEIKCSSSLLDLDVEEAIENRLIARFYDSSVLPFSHRQIQRSWDDRRDPLGPQFVFE